jgi:hypothetical protein
MAAFLLSGCLAPENECRTILVDDEETFFQKKDPIHILNKGIDCDGRLWSSYFLIEDIETRCFQAGGEGLNFIAGNYEYSLSVKSVGSSAHHQWAQVCLERW